MIRNYLSESIKDERNRSKTYVRVARMIDVDETAGGMTLPGVHIMPPDTLAIRAGEYGLDPADAALILDVVLYEPFLEYGPDDHPLWSAPSIAVARERHLDEVATVRARHAALGKDWDRPKSYPTSAVNRAALIRAAELSPIYKDTVLRARTMARETYLTRRA